MMMACVLVLSLRCIDVYGHGCELGYVEVVDVVSFSAFLDESFAAAIHSLMAFLVSLCKELGKHNLKLAWIMFSVVEMFHALLA